MQTELPMPVLTVTVDGAVQSVNGAARAFFGPAVTPGQSWPDFLADCNTPQPVIDAMWQSSTSVSLRLPNAHGQTVPCEILVQSDAVDGPLTVVCWPRPAHLPADPTLPARDLDAIHDATLRLANTFNNHLSAIRGLLQVIQDEGNTTSPELREALRITRHVAVSVADLQRTVRPPPPRLEWVDPATVVMDAVNTIRPDLRPGVTLTATHADDRPLIHADPEQIRDALLHLLTNARDAVADDGCLDIRIESPDTRRDQIPADLPATHFAVISVSDDGTGIPAVQVPRIHEPFFSTRGRTGLGLASVYQTIKQHGGGITVDTEVGTGSTFCLFLPANMPSTTAASAAAGRPAKATARARILVIDDDAAVRRVVRKCLEREGLEVDEAATGEEGLASHRNDEQGYDLIVLDIIMPGMSGWDVLHTLRDSGDTVPVILQSGFTSEVDKEASVLASAFLRKPYDLTDLSDAVRNALDTGV